MVSRNYEEKTYCFEKRSPLRLRIVEVPRETTTGPLIWGSLLPQSMGSGLIPDCPGYVLCPHQYGTPRDFDY